jgi:hypothetical protein
MVSIPTVVTPSACTKVRLFIDVTRRVRGRGRGRGRGPGYVISRKKRHSKGEIVNRGHYGNTRNFGMIAFRRAKVAADAADTR